MRTFLRSSSEEQPTEAAIRERRVELARRNNRWIELRESDLVRRGRMLVHADSDEVFTFYRGAIFEAGSGSILFNESVPLSFYVDRAGAIVFLERKPTTWSEIVARRARRAAV